MLNAFMSAYPHVDMLALAQHGPIVRLPSNAADRAAAAARAQSSRGSSRSAASRMWCRVPASAGPYSTVPCLACHNTTRLRDARDAPV